MYFLYKSEHIEAPVDTPFTVECARITPFHLFLKGERKRMKVLLSRLWLWLITFGHIKIFYVRNQAGALMHTSCVTSKCYKFPFMTKTDYQIGPCVTYPDFRGKGIYPIVLKHIVSTMSNGKSSFYMLVEEKNAASIKGIEKAGFGKSANIKKTRPFGTYVPIKE